MGVARYLLRAHGKADVVRRHLLRHVPDVAGCGHQMSPRRGLPGADELLRERLAEDRIRLDRQVWTHLFLDLDLRAGLECRALAMSSNIATISFRASISAARRPKSPTAREGMTF